MGAATATPESGILELYDKFRHDPGFRQINETGAIRFGALGFPAKKHEMYTFVNFRDFLSEQFDYKTGPEKMPAWEGISRHVYAGCEKSLVVIVDGKFSTALSDLAAHNNKITATEIVPDEVDLADVQNEDDTFACVNALFLTGGVKIEIGEGLRTDLPLEVLHISTGRKPGDVKSPAYTPRIDIKMSGASKAAIVMKFIGAGGGYFTNGVCNVILEEAAELDLTMIQGDPADSYHFFKTLARQKKGSRLNIVCATNGGKLVRRHFECRLKGEEAALTLLNLAILDGAEQAHNYVRVHHEAPNCTSFEHYKNILNGRSAASVDSTVTVHPGAQLAQSQQLINNLMFSTTARADSKPRLIIHADDVKCKHGATVGRIDENQIFYLMSRGLSENAAKGMIITGFAKSILNAIPSKTAADDAGALLLGKLGEKQIG
jgi:Fe-S cluster assembly protein SufD